MLVPFYVCLRSVRTLHVYLYTVSFYCACSCHFMYACGASECVRGMCICIMYRSQGCGERESESKRERGRQGERERERSDGCGTWQVFSRLWPTWSCWLPPSRVWTPLIRRPSTRRWVQHTNVQHTHAQLIEVDRTHINTHKKKHAQHASLSLSHRHTRERTDTHTHTHTHS